MTFESTVESSRPASPCAPGVPEGDAFHGPPADQDFEMRVADRDVLPSTVRVVLVDARDERRNLMHHVVEGDGQRALIVGEARSQDAALLLVNEERADAVVVDIAMPVHEGLRTIRALRRSFPRLGIVVCSFDLGGARAAQALAEGADACLAKPASRHDLLAALEAASSQPDPLAGVSVAAVPIGSARTPVVLTGQPIPPRR